jgi:TetR/AcrR family transcriptional regulator, transcriptional repressor of aconitase
MASRMQIRVSSIGIQECIVLKPRKRLTREESKQVTHMRLIEAAEWLFIRKSFDDVSVDEISETAGYSRGAFYSNFEDKEQVFLALMDRRRREVLKTLDDIFRTITEPALRIPAVREWFSNLWRLKDFVALQTEFGHRAMRARSVREHLTEIRRQDLKTYARWMSEHFGGTGGVPADRAEIAVLVLWAVTQGLGSLGIDADPEWEQICSAAAKLAFDRMTTPPMNQPGGFEC